LLAFVFVLRIIIFGSVRFLLKTNNQINFFKKKPKPNRTGSNLLVLVRFKFFRKKPVQTGLTRFLLGFSGFDSVFLIWLGFFFLFGFGLVRFFRFQAYKTETEPVGFFKILIGFFFTVRFFSFFFPVFSV
jgi:hypothetical protein